MASIQTRGEKIFAVFNYALLTLICVVTLYPLWHVLMASVSDPVLVLNKRGLFLLPAGQISFLGYKLVIENPNILSGYMNTMIYLILGTLGSMLTTIMGAYALSRRGVYWIKFIMLGIVFTMYFQGGLIPFFLQVRNMGLMNTRAAVILPIMVGTWNLIIMRTAFAGVPESLVESAKIDGASDWRVIWQIMVPAAKATVAVVTLWYAVRLWNEWFAPSIFLSSKEKWPIQLHLREILLRNAGTNVMTQVSTVGQTGQEMYRKLVKYCTIVVATVPILAVYPFLQKYFVQGVMIGSVKG